MRDDFAVMIVTNGRPNKQNTYDTLKKQGYTGKCYFIVDNLDKAKDEYIEKYGDAVHIFDKAEMFKKTDTMTNAQDMRAAVFGRNAAAELAEQLGLKYYAMCDDDITRIQLKLNVNQKMKNIKIKDMDNVIEICLKYMDNAPISIFSFSQEGAYLGGLNGGYKNGFQWPIAQFFFVRVTDGLRYRAMCYEDYTTANKGLVAFSTYLISITSPQEGTNEGGMKEAYTDMGGKYIRSFYCMMAYPTAVRLTIVKGNIQMQKKFVYSQPRIISDKWRKRASE